MELDSFIPGSLAASCATAGKFAARLSGLVFHVQPLFISLFTASVLKDKQTNEKKKRGMLLQVPVLTWIVILFGSTALWCPAALATGVVGGTLIEGFVARNVLVRDELGLGGPGRIYTADLTYSPAGDTPVMLFTIQTAHPCSPIQQLEVYGPVSIKLNHQICERPFTHTQRVCSGFMWCSDNSTGRCAGGSGPVSADAVRWSH